VTFRRHFVERLTRFVQIFSISGCFPTARIALVISPAQGFAKALRQAPEVGVVPANLINHQTDEAVCENDHRNIINH
jgi:hypothetical protein